jgi:hypothetical protein
LPETFIGFINHIRRRPGDVFSISDEPRRPLFKAEKERDITHPDKAAIYAKIKDKDGNIPKDFSFKWMEPVDEATPEKITTSQAALDQRSEMIRQEKAAAREAEKDVL